MKNGFRKKEVLLRLGFVAGVMAGAALAAALSAKMAASLTDRVETIVRVSLVSVWLTETVLYLGMCRIRYRIRKKSFTGTPG